MCKYLSMQWPELPHRLKKYFPPVWEVEVCSFINPFSLVQNLVVNHDVAIKAQVLAGGRGKGKFQNGFVGGVHMVTE